MTKLQYLIGVTALLLFVSTVAAAEGVVVVPLNIPGPPGPPGTANITVHPGACIQTDGYPQASCAVKFEEILISSENSICFLTAVMVVENDEIDEKAGCYVSVFYRSSVQDHVWVLQAYPESANGNEAALCRAQCMSW